MNDRLATFQDIPVGALFKFRESGSLLTKTGCVSYAAPQWNQQGLTTSPETQVIPYLPPLHNRLHPLK